MDVSKFPSHPPFSLGRAEPRHGGPRAADLPKAKFTVVACLEGTLIMVLLLMFMVTGSGNSYLGSRLYSVLHRSRPQVA